MFFVLTLNRDWRSARRLSRLGLCFHSQSFCARSLLSRVLSYLTVGARVTFSSFRKPPNLLVNALHKIIPIDLDVFMYFTIFVLLFCFASLVLL